MSRSIRPVAVALGVAVSLAVPAGALAAGHNAPNLRCDSSQPVYSGTYDNVVVPPGETCNLSGATVYGNVTVGTGAQLSLSSSGSVGGGVVVGSQAAAFEDSGWTIGGALVGNGAGSLGVLGTVHGILANKVAVLTMQNATINGSVVSNQGQFGGAVAGSLITGQLLINASGDPSSPATWVIGGTQLDGSPQEIDGNLVLTNNQAEILIFFNHIKQNLVCEGNNPPPINSVGGIGNTVDGRSVGQCATTNTGTPSPAALSAAKSALAR